TVNTVVVLLIKGEPVVYEAPLTMPESGDFVDEMSVAVPNIPDETDVLYTLDGSSPGPESEKYAGPLSIIGDVTFRAAFFKDGKRISGISGRNFRKVSPVPGNSLKEITPGLQYEYFTGEFDMLPDFQTLRPVTKGVSGGVMFPEDVRPEDFALRFYGYVNIPADGLYYFSLASDDGSCMFINGKQVINNDGLHGNIEKKAGLPLGKGLHQAEIQYFQKKGGRTLSLRIEGPAGSVIPDSLFFYAGS
ncbi:MAG: PA14 domain-containing protein, partial [Bacteroidales bacterium]|nr:PA14 domain-containing protein [Bacteroidales bacterium]